MANKDSTSKDKKEDKILVKSDIESPKDKTRRKLLTSAAYTAAGVGVTCALLPFIDSMNPSEDVQALASIEVDISGIAEGDEKKVMWRGKPIFIKHRTKKEIEEARAVPLIDLKDPQEDSKRVKPGKEQ